MLCKAMQWCTDAYKSYVELGVNSMTLQTLEQTCVQLVHLHLKIHTLCSIHTQRHAYKPFSWFTCTYKSIHLAQSTCKAVLTNPTVGSITYENAHILALLMGVDLSSRSHSGVEYRTSSSTSESMDFLWTDGRTDGRTDRQIDRQTDRQIDRQTDWQT